MQNPGSDAGVFVFTFKKLQSIRPSTHNQTYAFGANA
jgi:hypothetical protein